MKRAFIQVPILVAIVIGVILLGGGAYFVVNQKFSSEISEATPPVNLQTTVKTETNTSPQVQFSVMKVPANTVLDFSSREPTFPISITTEPRDADPKTLSLCFTLLNEFNVVLTETDCWPLEKYGTFSSLITGDFSLSPIEQTDVFWDPGRHRAKFQFELVQGITNDYGSERVRNRYPLIAKDDTGIFELYIPKE